VTGLPRPIPEEATTERLIPLPTYLASSACSVSGESFSGGGGRYSRVFVGVTDGWPGATDPYPTAEDVAAHLDEIEDRGSFIVPNSMYDVLRAIAEQIARRDGKPMPVQVES
jgi:hypothetical protein